MQVVACRLPRAVSEDEQELPCGKSSDAECPEMDAGAYGGENFFLFANARTAANRSNRDMRDNAMHALIGTAAACCDKTKKKQGGKN